MKTSNPRTERERQRRNECKKSILLAAESLIIRRGLNAVTMDDVACEAQFSKATLYRYFRDKGELIFEILIHYYDEIIETMTNAMTAPISAGEKIRLTIRRALQTYKDKENISRALMMDRSVLKVMKIMVAGEPRPSSSTANSFFHHIMVQRQKTLDMGQRILAEGMASGEFRKVDIEGTSALLEAVLQGYFHCRLWAQKKTTLRAETERIYDFIMRGIEDKDTRRKGELT